jgi:hypothetical protein
MKVIKSNHTCRCHTRCLSKTLIAILVVINKNSCEFIVSIKAQDEDGTKITDIMLFINFQWCLLFLSIVVNDLQHMFQIIIFVFDWMRF